MSKELTDMSDKEINDVLDSIFVDTGKTKFISASAANLNKVVMDGVERMNNVINIMKELPNEQIENFLVSLVKRSTEHGQYHFHGHPLPNAAARDFICKHFEGGKP